MRSSKRPSPRHEELKRALASLLTGHGEIREAVLIDVAHENLRGLALDVGGDAHGRAEAARAVAAAPQHVGSGEHEVHRAVAVEVDHRAGLAARHRRERGGREAPVGALHEEGRHVHEVDAPVAVAVAHHGERVAAVEEALHHLVAPAQGHRGTRRAHHRVTAAPQRREPQAQRESAQSFHANTLRPRARGLNAAVRHPGATASIGCGEGGGRYLRCTVGDVWTFERASGDLPVAEVLPAVHLEWSREYAERHEPEAILELLRGIASSEG